MAVTSQQVTEDCRLHLRRRIFIFILVVRQLLPYVYVPVSEVTWRKLALSKRRQPRPQWCCFLRHNTITPHNTITHKIKYFRNTYFQNTRQRRHRLSLKRFGVDRSCLQPSHDSANMTHVTVPAAHRNTALLRHTRLLSYSGGERCKKFCDYSLLWIRGFWDVGLCLEQTASWAFGMCAPRRVTDRPRLHSRSTDNPKFFLELFLWIL
jgi:hypothetical protein